MKIKILHIITDLSVGGAEMMLYKLLSRMDQNQFENVVISLKERAVVGEKIEALGIRVFYLQMKSIWSILKSANKLIKTSRRFNPVIIMGWMYHSNLCAYFLRFFLKKPVTLTWNIRHSLSKLGYEKTFTQFVIKIGALLSKKIPIIVFNSATSFKQHRNLGFSFRKFAVIPNCFDTFLYAPSPTERRKSRKRLSVTDDEIFIGHIGRYHPMKDHSRFIASAKELSDKYPEVQFVMVGRGVEERNHLIRDQLIALGILNRFRLLGERMDVHAILASLDIFVSTSAWGEGFPNVLGEAMACGIPCVATDVGDSPFVVADTGVVVPPQDTPALVSGISALIDTGKEGRRTLGQKARLRVVKKFNISTVTKEYETIFKSILMQGNAQEKTRGSSHSAP